ncbi:hypothetical protein RI129_003879 [Pyrocoelia pectoralis]|uniref:Uncharacterized protein n=1 Tax=Pyrocoelia pectoralis TaxID=417401 RepID=A0AAN7VIM6_9COLE
MLDDYEICLIIILCLIVALICIIRKYVKQQGIHFLDLMYGGNVQAQQTVWSVTGQINRDGSADNNQRWPTHDHRLSVDSFIVTENVRMQQKDRLPPPAYSEIDLPTYEQAVCMTPPKNNVPAVHTASSSTTNLDRPS